MKSVLLLIALAMLAGGCASYKSQGAAGTDPNTQIFRGTTAVSSGADPGWEITGSDFAPPR